MTKQSKAKVWRINEKIRQTFHERLADWYRQQARDLPWRKTNDPYAITVSELMLQQTQVVTVIPYYERWLERFPSWDSLAKAPEAAVIKMWEGLGYYSRARNLHRLAQAVILRDDGQLPRQPEELVKLPGIGPYTAGAVASLAFGQKAALVDGNVMRVFARVFDWHEDISERAAQQSMWTLAQALLPEAEACAVHNSALMEVGATVCFPRKPQCLLCPLQAICRAKNPELLPVKKRTATEGIKEQIALIRKGDDWWLEPGPSKGRLAGFWRFPHLDCTEMERGELVQEFTYGITRYRVHLQAYWARWKRRKLGVGRWFTSQELEEMPLSAAHRKIRNRLKNDVAKSLQFNKLLR